MIGAIALAGEAFANSSSGSSSQGCCVGLPVLGSSSFTDSLSGTIDLSSQWSLNLGGNLTLQGRTPASQRGQFRESGSIVTLFTGGADWNVTDNLALGAELQLSPRSTQFAGTSVALRQANGTETSADALVRSQTSQAGATFTRSASATAGASYRW